MGKTGTLVPGHNKTKTQQRVILQDPSYMRTSLDSRITPHPCLFRREERREREREGGREGWRKGEIK